MRRNLFAVLMVCALLLSGCQLAQPEAELVGEDHFCGFYVVPFRRNPESPLNEGDVYDSAAPSQRKSEDTLTEYNFYDNPNLTAYGKESLNLGDYGSFSMDREVLFAEETPEGHGLVFPGMPEGYSLFHYTYEDEHGSVSAVQSDMGPGEEGTHITVTDKGQEISVSGVIYMGPPLGASEDWLEEPMEIVWRAYRVWETADGRVYLDGSGNSYSTGATGISSSMWEDHSFTYQENGETVKTDTITVKVTFQTVPRPERLSVYQYDENSALLGTEEIALGEELQKFTCLPGTAWVVVEEGNTDGAVHTAYDLTEEGVFHEVILLDEAGRGRYAQLEITV